MKLKRPYFYKIYFQRTYCYSTNFSLDFTHYPKISRKRRKVFTEHTIDFHPPYDEVLNKKRKIKKNK